MKLKILIIYLAVLFMFVGGCQAVDVPEPANTPQIDLTGVTVVPEVEATAAPAAVETEQAYVFKKSEPDTITVKGLLLVTNPTGLIPDPDDGIFLVPLPQQDANITGVPEFTVGDVPQADVNEAIGDFVFTNIEPGQYIVIVLSDGGSQVPASRDDGSAVVVTLTEADRNKTIDLGILRFP